MADFTVCVAFCCICSKYFHGEEHLLNIMVITLDVLVYSLTIVLLRFLVKDHEVDLADSLLLFLLFPLYIILSSSLNKSNWFSDHNDKINMITQHGKGEILPMSSMDDQEMSQNFFGSRSQEPNESEEEEKLISAVFYRRPNRQETNLTLDHSFNGLTPKEQEAFQRFKGDQPIQIPKTSHGNEETKEHGGANNNAKTIQDYDGTNRPLATVITTTLLRPLGVIYHYAIPMRYPILAFSVCLLFLFIFTQYTMFSVEQLSAFMGVSVTFVGLVFTSWGNNVGDLTTTIISAKAKMAGQATSSLFGSQIINIQVSLGFPWMVKNILYGPVKLNDPNIPSSIEAIILVLFAMYLILIFGKMKLNYCNGTLILIVYFLYISYEISQNWSEPAHQMKGISSHRHVREPGGFKPRGSHHFQAPLHVQG